MQFECVFCGYTMDKNIPGPIDVVVCPSCRTKVEIMQENSTMAGETILFVRILKEGKKK